MTTELPPFLHGCFDWRENGLHWDADYPYYVDLHDSTGLDRVNPWMVVAAVVDRAKRGNHDYARHLRPFFHRHDPFGLARVSLLVYADIARPHELVALQAVLAGDDILARQYAAEAAALAGQISLVPAMLDAWTRAETAHDHEIIGFAISDILEPEPGEIADHAGVWDTKSPRAPSPGDSPALVRLLEMQAERVKTQAPSEFPGLVTDAYNALRAKLGGDRFVWEGELLSVARLVTRLLTAAKQGRRSIGAYLPLRHRLEAWTGMDCRAFFYAGEPRRLEIAAALESLVESGKLKHYVPGQRYFWGHPIF